MISIWGTHIYAKLNVLTRKGTNKYELLNKRLCCDDDGDYNFGLAITQIFTELRTYQIAHYIDHTCMLGRARARATPRIACFCKCLLICFSYVARFSPPSIIYLPLFPTPFMFQLTFKSHYYRLYLGLLMFYFAVIVVDVFFFFDRSLLFMERETIVSRLFVRL